MAVRELLAVAVTLVLAAAVAAAAAADAGEGHDAADDGAPRGLHDNNWAVLVCSSRYWFNYRHIANTLSVYRLVRRLGVPDSRIILMLPEDAACNSRNPRKGAVFGAPSLRENLYGGGDIEVDYRGSDVSVESLLRLLTGRHAEDVPAGKRLLSDERSNVLVYLTGHGGDEFIKFNDQEEVSSHDLADAFEQMHAAGRYRRVLFLSDTCQAATLQDQFRSPGIVAIGSSARGENSYSRWSSPEVGASLVDRFTSYTVDFFGRPGAAASASVADLFGHYASRPLRSTPEWRDDLVAPERLADIPAADLFGRPPPVLEGRTKAYPFGEVAEDVAVGGGAGGGAGGGGVEPPPSPPERLGEEGNVRAVSAAESTSVLAAAVLACVAVAWLGDL